MKNLVNETEIAFESDDLPRLSEGMHAILEVIIQEKKNALGIPDEYLIQKDSKNFVMLLEEGKAILQEIRLGIRGKEYLEVLEGLRVGDQLILPQEKT